MAASQMAMRQAYEAVSDTTHSPEDYSMDPLWISGVWIGPCLAPNPGSNLLLLLTWSQPRERDQAG